MNEIAIPNKTAAARSGFTSYSLKVLALLLMTCLLYTSRCV